MKRTAFLIAAASAFACLGYAAPALSHHIDEPVDSLVEEPDTTGFCFTDIKVLPHTGVKDQNKSGTCWCFATTSFFEDEIMREKGDSIHISEMYTVRNAYTEKADRYIRLYGNTNFPPGGSALDVAYIMARYGAMPNDAYPGLNYGEEKHVHGEVDAVLNGIVKAVASRPTKKVSTAWRNAFQGVLDAYFGEVPETFTYNGRTYTPQTYLQSLGLDLDNYVGITSYTHHPFYEKFILEMPDNWVNGMYYNVPMEEMKAIVDNALENGYPVLWAADVSEKGFKWYDGVALMPKEKTEADMTGTELARWVKLSDSDRAQDAYNFTGPVEEITVTQEMRQETFDNQLTTDDHAMEIIGIARDREGNRYYKVKNSWDTNQIFDGYIYVSEPYFLAKTLDIYVNRNAIPRSIARKMNL